MRAAVLIALACALAVPVRAQLVSPGKLSNVHAGLEGVGNCTQCHDFGSNTFRARCLACHSEIQARIDKGYGYHTFTKKLECSTCHKEHHGRDFKLIRWEPDKFDHKQAGFALEGKHAGRQCRECHVPKNIVQPQIRKKPMDAQQHTFLGLEPACGNCHRDEHRGQLGRECANCHTPADWKKNTFTHDKARFQLAGKHASVECTKCHPRQQAQDGASADKDGWMRFKGIAFKGCMDCHQDTHHKGAFGKDCQNCHAPAGWKQVRISKGSFDHSRTHFPLTGRHALVACTGCHTGGSATKFTGKDLASCRTCHDDAHAGQFASRADRGECSSCHTVEGFVPARFDPALHRETHFPLTGAHGAVPCGKCHTEGTVGKMKTRVFRWKDLACTACHADQHAGQFTAVIERKGCEGCHVVQGWHEMQFDHAATAFQLTGRHSSVACDRCHVQGEVAGMHTTVYRLGTPACARCHADKHAGQFADASGATACERCHTPEDWRPSRFDHATMSRFRLSGRHAQVECVKCHKPGTTDNAAAVRRFKPLDTTCVSCHTDFKE